MISPRSRARDALGGRRDLGFAADHRAPVPLLSNPLLERRLRLSASEHSRGHRDDSGNRRRDSSDLGSVSNHVGKIIGGTHATIGVAKRWLAPNYAMRTASQNSAVELLAISSIASNEPICAAPQPRRGVAGASEGHVGATA